MLVSLYTPQEPTKDTLIEVSALATKDILFNLIYSGSVSKWNADELSLQQRKEMNWSTSPLVFCDTLFHTRFVLVILFLFIS